MKHLFLNELITDDLEEDTSASPWIFDANMGIDPATLSTISQDTKKRSRLQIYQPKKKKRAKTDKEKEISAPGKRCRYSHLPINTSAAAS